MPAKPSLPPIQRLIDAPDRPAPRHTARASAGRFYRHTALRIQHKMS
jgi:hypothetical protein